MKWPTLPPSSSSVAAQDDGRRDAVDVVVAVDGDALADGQRPRDARDRLAAGRQPRRVVQMIERRLEEAGRRVGSVEPAQREQPRDDRLEAEGPRQPIDGRGRSAVLRAPRCGANHATARVSSANSCAEAAHARGTSRTAASSRSRDGQAADVEQAPRERRVEQRRRRRRVRVRAADRLGNDLVDDAAAPAGPAPSASAPRRLRPCARRRARESRRSLRAG